MVRNPAQWLFWKRRTSNRISESTAEEPTAPGATLHPDILIESVPRKMPQYSATQIEGEMRFQTWLDDVIEQHQRDGGFLELEGKGKPLKLNDSAFNGDGMVYGILKNANTLPEWLEIQHEVRDGLRRLVELESILSGSEVERRVASLNDLVRRYNDRAPSEFLRRPLLRADSLVNQLTNWE